LRARKAPGSNHHVGDGGARTGEDQLGRQIDPEALTRKPHHSQAAARYAVSDGRLQVGCVVELDGVFIAIDPADRLIGIFATLRDAADAVADNISGSRSGGDAA
jgi:hypothetical protein